MLAPDEVPLHVEVEGPETAPVTVVLAHGWTLDSTTWAPVSSALAGPGARVVRYDHRGHGRSGAADPASMTLDQLADDLAAVVAAAAPTGPLVLAGHSMGGMTLMALAERHPDVVARAAGIGLVATASGGLADTSFGLPQRTVPVVRAVEERIFGSKRWAAGSRLGTPGVLTPAARWLLLGPDADREAVRTTARSLAACRPSTMSGFRPTLAAHDRDEALAAFAAIPTVVLAGSRDRLTPLRAARRIRAALPSASLTIFPEAGHMLPLERVAGVSGRLGALVRGALGRLAA
ncbi:alpha/beta fold hydrolase [Pseudonocardia sp. KRD-184]|uniref:Alpha/beta fold hydrolase n=1 Tax=Pseudonocardia oceani TaxID=2792013 RepID=A0ABS6UD91_9PSEU|nr:alpha/beta hydrolase [Pseudonocardia oceani]MBW0088519.1 alpha/beta fold hydrolase [Pseudonocardia oceani]MBW0095427.1 alpha/beta fold hydrolase [Pseudonocardia oceani]MBW0108090.1 alpha/beta fold hydrolase [Pseudonocardia oceani]MBW0122014.1 alpha/beta fold hydrolase [Pseudonocardia oceani]MBW0129794.1 alpha/beta fold hydrolase [Pseudonocardia oceani]